jgi:pyruvate-formate lyase-activating enzyme
VAAITESVTGVASSGSEPAPQVIFII